MTSGDGGSAMWFKRFGWLIGLLIGLVVGAAIMGGGYFLRDLEGIFAEGVAYLVSIPPFAWPPLRAESDLVQGGVFLAWWALFGGWLGWAMGRREAARLLAGLTVVAAIAVHLHVKRQIAAELTRALDGLEQIIRSFLP